MDEISSIASFAVSFWVTDYAVIVLARYAGIDIFVEPISFSAAFNAVSV
jgi:hypothetical protein